MLLPVGLLLFVTSVIIGAMETTVIAIFVVSVVIGAAMISTVVILLSSSYVIIGVIIGIYFYHRGVCCKASCVLLVMYLTAVSAQDDKGRVLVCFLLFVDNI